jgi:hypothetical protein
MIKRFFFISMILVLFWVEPVDSQGIRYRVVDRRQLDGSVILVKNVLPKRLGKNPFRAADFWRLDPVSEYFRIRSGRVPARYVPLKGDPPAITFEAGNVVPNSWTNLLGGTPRTFFETGEIVRLVRLNSAFKTVRMDLESVCRPEAVGKHLRGRIDFILSGQVGEKTFEEANTAVGTVLEPVDYAQILESCDPATGKPPAVIHVGMRIEDIEALLGPPLEDSEDDQGTALNYGVIRVRVREGRVDEIMVPAID